jgi:hypothetical protein
MLIISKLAFVDLIFKYSNLSSGYRIALTEICFSKQDFRIKSIKNANQLIENED